jgi:hypothetical protein
LLAGAVADMLDAVVVGWTGALKIAYVLTCRILGLTASKSIARCLAWGFMRSVTLPGGTR